MSSSPPHTRGRIRTTVIEVGEGAGRIWSRTPFVQTCGLMSFLRPIAANNSFKALRFNVHGDKFVVIDQRGNVYVFNVLQNRYNLLIRTGCSPTACVFSHVPKTFLAVASSDHILRIIDIEASNIVATLKGHRTAISSLSFAPNGQYLASTSGDRVIVWDTLSWSRCRTLDTQDVTQASFSSNGDSVLTCINAQGIVAWDALRFTMTFRLPPPNPTLNVSTNINRFAISSDGRYVVGGGSSSNILLWETHILALLRIAVMPVSVTEVRQLAFLADSEVIVVLGNDGILLFYNGLTLEVLLSIHEAHKCIESFDVGSGGRYCACVMSDGNVSLYDLDKAFENEKECVKNRLKNGATKEDLSNFLGSRSVFGERERKAPIRVATVDNVSSRVDDIIVSNDEVDASLHVINNDADSSKQFDEQDGIDLVRCKADANDEMALVSHNESSQSQEQQGRYLPLKPEKLKALLRGQGQYPDKYRMLIWRFLLRVPLNRELYATLSQRGEHAALNDLDKRYPLKDRRLARRLHNLLSSIAHWSPLFAEIPYLPSIVFPFVQLFPSDNVIIFEVVITLLLNWCRHWFEFFPNPPIDVLQEVEGLMRHHAAPLLKHINSLGVEVNEYAWPLLQTMFTEVLSKRDWLVLMDHILSNRPSFLLFVVVSYLRVHYSTLIMLKSHHSLSSFIHHHHNAIELSALLRDAYSLRRSTPSDIAPTEDSWIPLLPHSYPPFDNYPKFVVDYQLKEHERIRLDEQELLDKKTSLLDLQQRVENLGREREAWRIQQATLRVSERERRQKWIVEEEKRLRERQRLDRESHLRRKQQVDLISETLTTKMRTQKEQRTAELKRVEDEELRRRAREEYEIEQRLEEEALLNLEFQMNQKVNDIATESEHAEAMQAMRASAEAQQMKRDLRMTQLKEQWRQEDEERRICNQLQRERREKLAKFNAELRDQRQSEAANIASEAEHDMKVAAVVRERRLRHLAQDELARHDEVELEERHRLKLLAKEDELMHNDVLQREAAFRAGIAREREHIIDEEKRRAQLETEKRAIRLQEMEREQRRREFEEAASQRHRGEVERLRSEEKELQAVLTCVDEESRRGRELEIEIRHRDEKAQEQLAFTHMMSQAKRSVVEDERKRYKILTADMRAKFRREEHDLEEQHKHELDKIISQRELVFHDKNEDWRLKVRSDELQRIKDEHSANRARKRALQTKHQAEEAALKTSITEALSRASKADGIDIHDDKAFFESLDNDHIKDDDDDDEVDDEDSISKQAQELVRSHQKLLDENNAKFQTS